MIALANRLETASNTCDSPTKYSLAALCQELARGLTEATRREPHHALRNLFGDYQSLFSQRSREVNAAMAGAAPRVSAAAGESVVQAVETLVEASGQAPIEEVVEAATAASDGVVEACQAAIDELADSPFCLPVVRLRQEATALRQRLAQLQR